MIYEETVNGKPIEIEIDFDNCVIFSEDIDKILIDNQTFVNFQPISKGIHNVKIIDSLNTYNVKLFLLKV